MIRFDYIYKNGSFIEAIQNGTTKKLFYKDKTVFFQNFNFKYLLNQKNFSEEMHLHDTFFYDLNKLAKIIHIKECLKDIENLFYFEKIKKLTINIKDSQISVEIKKSNKKIKDNILNKYSDFIKISNKIPLTFSFNDNFEDRLNNYDKLLLHVFELNFFFFPVFEISTRDYFLDFLKINFSHNEKKNLLKENIFSIKRDCKKRL